MTARDIQQRLIADLYRRSFVVPNYTPAGWWECDLFEITGANFMREYEVKLSRGDFKADAAKERRDRTAYYQKLVSLPTVKTKHGQLAIGDPFGPVQFWYVCPAGLIDLEDLPPWAGLMEALERPGYSSPFNIMFSVVRKAPRLHNQKCLPKIRRHAESVCYYRMHQMWLGSTFDIPAVPEWAAEPDAPCSTSSSDSSLPPSSGLPLASAAPGAVEMFAPTV